MLGQLSLTCLRLWSPIQLDNPTGPIGPPRSRTWHYYFQLIQQLLNSVTWSCGLFLFHKDHLNAMLCNQPPVQELTISVSELQFCSLFPVSFSSCGWPLQAEPMAAPLFVFFKPEKHPSPRLQNWISPSSKLRATNQSVLPPDRQAQSIILRPPAQAVPSVFRYPRCSFHMKLIKHPSRFRPRNMYAICNQHV